MSNAILVVDDDPQFLASMQALLSSEGYQADTATNGVKTFHLMNRKSYDAILLDLKLADLNGMDIAEFITSNNPDTVVIILTGQACLDSAVKALRFGCYDYFCKPFASQKLLHTLKRGLENKHLKKELAASICRFKRLAEATSEGVAIFSRQGIVEVNEQFCSIFRCSEDDASGRAISEFIPLLWTIENSIRPWHSKLKVSEEAEGIDSSGRIFTLELTLSGIEEEQEPLWVVTLRDLTQQQSDERARAQLEEKLTHAMRMESIGLMAGSIAHDLNNILSSIVTFPELLLLDMPANARYRTDIDRIKHAGKQAAAVVSDLLTIARGSTCKKEVRNLNSLLQEYKDSLNYFDQTQDSGKITIHIDPDSDLANCRMSTVHVTNSLINLIRNGIEAIKGEGVVTISTENRSLTEPLHGFQLIPPGHYVILRVQDTGSGIPTHHLQHIFEPFYSKKQLGHSGTGLGLTVIHHTMRDHGGYVNVESRPGATSFELFFPAITARESDIAGTISLDHLLGRGEKVMVIDDDETQRLLIASILTRLGYEPLTAESGEQAIELLRLEPVDLLILDMILDPGMNGYETYRAIREMFPNQRALVTSGDHNHPDRERIATLGVNQYLGKPITLSHLALAIQKELGGHRV